MIENTKHTSPKTKKRMIYLMRNVAYHKHDNTEYVRCPYYGTQYCEKYDLINVTCNGWKGECNYE